MERGRRRVRARGKKGVKRSKDFDVTAVRGFAGGEDGARDRFRDITPKRPRNAIESKRTVRCTANRTPGCGHYPFDNTAALPGADAGLGLASRPSGTIRGVP